MFEAYSFLEQFKSPSLPLQLIDSYCCLSGRDGECLGLSVCFSKLSSCIEMLTPNCMSQGYKSPHLESVAYVLPDNHGEYLARHPYARKSASEREEEKTDRQTDVHRLAKERRFWLTFLGCWFYLCRTQRQMNDGIQCISPLYLSCTPSVVVPAVWVCLPTSINPV